MHLKYTSRTIPLFLPLFFSFVSILPPLVPPWLHLILSFSSPSRSLFSCSLLPSSCLQPPSLLCSFTLSTLVAPIMQMSVCGGALKSRLGPGSLFMVTWLFHRGQQEGGISTGMCACPCVHASCRPPSLVFSVIPSVVVLLMLCSRPESVYNVGQRLNLWTRRKCKMANHLVMTHMCVCSVSRALMGETWHRAVQDESSSPACYAHTQMHTVLSICYFLLKWNASSNN